MARPRIASAVVVSRVRDGQREVYLVERSQQLRFFGGYWACPGGTLDLGDRRDTDPEGSVDLSLRRCALREIFEEIGVLPGELRGDLGDSRAASLRGQLLADSGGAEEFARLLDRHPAVLESVEEICTLTTPEFAPVRYQTMFLSMVLAETDEPSVLPGELDQGSFFTPAEALRRWREGELLIVPPVLFLLEVLADHDGDLAGFRREVQQTCRRLDEGHLHSVRFTPGIFMAPLRTDTLPPATTTNCYLVGHRRVFVVDPAPTLTEEQNRLAATMDEWQAMGVEFEAILLTHHHPDHVGAVTEISRRFGLPVHGHPLTLDRIPPGFLRGRELHGGEELDLGEAPDGSPDWKLKAIYTPGHDRGHLCFVESRYGAAVVGDLTSTVSTIVIDPPEGHLATYLSSLRRMRAEPFGMLYPAHGPARADGHALLDIYLSHRELREAQLLAALGRGPAPARSLLAAVYDDVDSAMWDVAARSLEAGLEKLEEEGRARRLGGIWSLVQPSAGASSGYQEPPPGTRF